MQKDPQIRLYTLLPWDRGAKVRWLLNALEVPFEEKQMNREQKEHEKPEFLRINPMGRVPAVTIDDQAVFESGAICTYLADRFPEKGMAPAFDHAERADYLKWMFFASVTIDPIQTRIMIIEDIAPGELYDKKFGALNSDWNDVLETLELRLSKHSFLVGNRLTAADISVSYHLFWVCLWPELEVSMKKYPAVGAYMERMKKEPHAVRAGVFSYEG